jgi:hypothetical protein
MQAYSAIDGQSLFDVCLNTYGDIGYLYKLLQDNQVLNTDEVVKSGDVFIWDDSLVQNQQLNAAYAASGINYATEIGASQATSGFGIITETGLFILDETGKSLIQN